MNIEEALVVVDMTLEPERLSDIQEVVFRQCWSGGTYQEIAERYGYDADYIRVVGSRLWQVLSEMSGEKITKSNFRSVLRQLARESPGVSQATISPSTQIHPSWLQEFPDGPVPLDSALYVERSPIEARIYTEILKPGALLRIHAPRQMGKTSLLTRILAHANSEGYRTVRLNLQQADRPILEHLDRFLRWFCRNLAQQLHYSANLDDYWDEDLGSKVSCTTYLQGYLLGAEDRPLVLALDEVNRIFEYPKIAQEFLPLLRLWHEEANNLPIWQNLRLAIAHATEIYIPLHLHQSPFNVGLPIQLPEFTLGQVQDLAQRHGLAWAEGDVGKQRLSRLLGLVGGHPYLIRLALYYLVQGTVTLEQLLAQAPTQTGIYRHHLQERLVTLQENPDLSVAFQQVIAAQQPIGLETIAAYKLASLGLVKLQGDRVKPSCQLYCLYYGDRLRQLSPSLPKTEIPQGRSLDPHPKSL